MISCHLSSKSKENYMYNAIFSENLWDKFHYKDFQVLEFQRAIEGKKFLSAKTAFAMEAKSPNTVSMTRTSVGKHRERIPFNLSHKPNWILL